MTAPPSWGSPGADFLLSTTPRDYRLFTPLSEQARWFLPQLDPHRLLPRIGPALYLERTDAIAMVRLLQEHHFCLRIWVPLLTLTTAPAKKDTFKPWPKPPPEPRVQWSYDWDHMTERQLTIMASLLKLQPNHQTVLIPLP
jgi:hypothetical protein